MGSVPVVILCGGRSTRMGMRSVPKGLVEVGNRPLLWHVMKLYSAQGFDEFVLCLGYGADQIREAFGDDAQFNIRFVDTGLDTQTGGRIKRAAADIHGTFMATYQDGVARIDLNDLLRFHQESNRLATITCAQTNIPFGVVDLKDGVPVGFIEKPRMDKWVNGGFFVFEPGVLDYLQDDSTLEREPFEKLVADAQMSAYLLHDFWACMDTYKDALMLNDLWEREAPWKVWD